MILAHIPPLLPYTVDTRINAQQPSWSLWRWSRHTVYTFDHLDDTKQNFSKDIISIKLQASANTSNIYCLSFVLFQFSVSFVFVWGELWSPNISLRGLFARDRLNLVPALELRQNLISTLSTSDFDDKEVNICISATRDSKKSKKLVWEWDWERLVSGFEVRQKCRRGVRSISAKLGHLQDWKASLSSQLCSSYDDYDHEKAGQEGWSLISDQGTILKSEWV